MGKRFSAPSLGPVVWPQDGVAVLLTALAQARATGGDAGAAGRLVLHARALHSRVRSKAANRLFDMARLAARLDARIRHVDPGKLDGTARDAWRAAALLCAEENQPAQDVASAVGLPPEGVAALAGDDFLRGLTGAVLLSVQHSMPRWLVEHLLAQHDVEFCSALLTSLNARAPLFVRARDSRDVLLEELCRGGVDAVATRYSPWGLELRSHINVRGLKPFLQGRMEVQDEGSQLIACCAAAQPGEWALDVCAGAGGKTLALCAAFPKAKVVAMEPVPSRLAALKERARRGGHKPITVLCGLGDPASRAYAGKAHVVLMDAPCSGTGAMRREPTSRWRYTEADIAEFAATQTLLLRHAFDLVRPGGRLVYATCSMLRAENEDVVAAFLTQQPLARALPVGTLLGHTLATGLGAQGHEMRLWPHLHGTDGFYLAAIQRVP